VLTNLLGKFVSDVHADEINAAYKVEMQMTIRR
jgi:hypothetical protein